MKAQNVNPMFQVSEIQVSYQPNFKASERPKIGSSKDAFDVLISCWDKDQINLLEQCFMLVLNRANRVIGIREVSSGGYSGTVVDPKLIFGIALKCVGSSIIIGHNHPSENLRPSTSDLDITKKLTAAGRMLDLPVLDHLIVTAEGYYSFSDEGLI
ncbi:JAB domain-containing protein [Pedobacter deserti]|uniref:JAB domain-containing protein n=1 Tax=Pedobacter deserti TaxID=2817382 RepID=UPI00210D95FD|nr:JAB domain-containing protein [Pedobacter sp. SYSU D00382]